MTTTPSLLEERKILIIGPTGQVAFPLARDLARKNDVHGLARFARAEDRETRGFISMIKTRPVSGSMANWTFEPPVSTPIFRKTSIDASRKR